MNSKKICSLDLEWILIMKLKLLTKKNPKYKQIIKMINISVEHGIKQRIDYLYKYGVIMLFYLFEKLSSSKVFNQIKSEMNKEHDQITFGELSNLFALLLVAFPCLFVVFIVEFIYYKYKRDLTWF